jgi:hypothetical protein
LIVGDRAKSRIIDIGRQRGGFAGGSECARDETLALWILTGEIFDRLPGIARARYVQFVCKGFHAVIGHGNGRGIKCIGFDEVRARRQVLPMDLLDDLRLRKRKEIVIAFHIGRPILESLAAIVSFFKFVSLDHRPHRAIDNGDSLL